MPRSETVGSYQKEKLKKKKKILFKIASEQTNIGINLTKEVKDLH